MQMHRRNSGDNFCHHQLDRGLLMESPPPTKFVSNDSSSVLMQPSSASSSGGGGSSVGDGGLGYIEHTVSRFDTLAGVAIKYGVEVADIKRMNSLTTDQQMFALKTLHIPLPGRHPPSPVLSNGCDIQGSTKSDATPPQHRRHSDLFDSIKSLKLSPSAPQNVSPSMDALRGYYGLKPNENGSKPSPRSNPTIGLHRKCKSLANGFSEEGANTPQPGPGSGSGSGSGSDKWINKLLTRHKSEVDLKTQTPEMIMLKQDNTNTSGAFSAAAGKGLALRPKAASRTASDAEGLQLSGVKKSSSTPSFLDTDASSSSIWPTSVLNLTADLQALSTAAIARPMFDGLPKPMSGRKNKAAID